MKITNAEFNAFLFYLLLNLHKKQGQDCWKKDYGCNHIIKAEWNLS